MTRPAVVIGLGGTGQWILTYLKKDLMELNNGVMPPNVRLLAFDTVSQAEAQKQVVGGTYSGDQAAYEKAAKKIGHVELQPDVELVHIGGDCYELGREIQQGRHPHLGWFDAEYWMRTLSRDNWILDRGAGRFRQFGLLAVYKDLLGGPVRSEILKRMPRAINEVLSTVQGDASFEVIVISSVAGGTGSAMLVPFGVLARKVCGDKPVRTRGIVVLPSAFSPGRPNAELELRGGAALRELARAMMPPEGYTASVNFLPGDREYEDVKYSRPFDGIYLIDGTRNQQPINNDPKYGVFPATAAWVRQILDDRSGQWFTNYVATNRAGSQIGDPVRLAEGVFGVFGVHSLYTPKRSLEQTYRLKLADRTLREFIDPKPEGPGGRLIPNPLPKGVPEPAALALSWLNQTATYGDEQQPVTLLLNEVGRIITAGAAAGVENVRRYAGAGTGTGAQQEQLMEGWTPHLIDLPHGGKFDALRQDVDRELGDSFLKRFPPSDASTPPLDPCSQAQENAFTHGIDAVYHGHIGGMGADGPDDYGSFGDIAKRCADEQVGIFQNVLRLRLLGIMSEEKGRGRLGYALRVLEALSKHLEDFLSFLKEVETVRGREAPRVNLQTQIAGAEKTWRQLKCEPPTLLEKVQNKRSAKAIRAEKGYLRSRFALWNYVREDAAHINAKRAVQAMLTFCEGTRAELDRWAKMLLEGDRALDISGLLPDIKNDADRITTLIREDQRSEEVEELIQASARESRIADADVDWALAGLKWAAENDGTALRFALNMAPQGVMGGSLQVVREGMTLPQRRSLEQRNKEALGRVFGQRFGQIEKITSVIDWVQTHEQYNDPAQLANALVAASAPMTSLSTGARPGMEAFSISLNREVDPEDYAGRLEKAARVKLIGGVQPDNNYPVEVVPSEDPDRLSAVRTQVGLKLDEFAAWTVSETAYEAELKKASNKSSDELKPLVRTLQSHFTQREEKEAVALEVQWRAEGLAHRVLNPRMVSLLGKSRELQLALQAWALGWVQDVPDEEFPDLHHWELKVPGWGYEYWLTPNRKPGEIGPFEVLEAFVLVGQNHARGREGALLRWNDLNQALLAQRKPLEEGKPSLMAEAVSKAQATNGFVVDWDNRAGREIDRNTQKEIFKVPAYRDLADYARRYFKGATW